MTCAIGAGATVCWGDNEQGELAIGSLTVDHEVAPTTTLVKGATALAGPGNSPLCALVAGGRLECWGPAQTGELGNGSYSGDGAGDAGIESCGPEVIGCVPAPEAVPSLTFRQVSSGQEVQVVASGTGANYGGHVLALGTDGKVYGWGANLYGEAGHAPKTSGDRDCYYTTAQTATAVPCAPRVGVVEGVQ